MYFVGGVGVPNDELSILRGRDKMSTIGSPVHGVDFSQVTPKSPTRSHDDSGQ